MSLDELNDIIEVLERSMRRHGKEREGRMVFRANTVQRVCVDCKCVVEGYMVHDELWQSAFYSKKELACIACLEKRLYRPLTVHDFTKSIININIFRAYRMGFAAREEIHKAADEARRIAEENKPQVQCSLPFCPTRRIERIQEAMNVTPKS